MRQSVEIDGVKYVIGTYPYSKDVEITDRVTTLDFDQKTKTATPVMKAGLHRLLALVASIREWTFRGLDSNDEIITSADVKILPITEESVGMLPIRHANKLNKIVEGINNLGETEEKNLST